MRRRWRFGEKTRVVECKDGRQITVFNNVDDVFPLAVHGWRRKFKAGHSQQDLAALGLEADLTRVVEGLLVRLNSQNESLMLMLRTLYITFQSDPCTHQDYYLEETTKLIARQETLTEAKVLLEKVIELCRTGCSAEEAHGALDDVATMLGNPYAFEARRAIEEIRPVADRALGPGEFVDSPESPSGEA